MYVKGLKNYEHRQICSCLVHITCVVAVIASSVLRHITKPQSSKKKTFPFQGTDVCLCSLSVCLQIFCNSYTQ